MKKLLLYSLFLCSLVGVAQQIGPVSHFSMDPYFFNPAAAGSNTQLEAFLGYRNQWAGLQNSPKNYFLSAHKAIHVSTINSLLNKKYLKGHVQNQKMFTKKQGSRYVLKHALGVNMGSDQAGAFRRSIVGVSYALHLPFDNFSIAIGTTAGFGSFKLDPTKVTLLEDNDATYNAYLLSGGTTNFMNVNSGIFLYSDHFYFGYATNQVFSQKLMVGKSDLELGLNAHHFISAGGMVELSEDFQLKPNILIGLVSGLPVNWHINTLLSYKNTYEGGVGLRRGDAVTFQAGYTFKEMCRLSYAYDYNVSDLKQFNSGSHELVLMVKIP